MTEFILTRILRFMGKKLDGYKTIIGGVGFIMTGGLSIIRIMFPDLTHFPDMPIGEALASIFAGFAAIGLGSKAEKLTEKVQKGNEIVNDGR